jgi:RNA polymerase sigma-32 factor
MIHIDDPKTLKSNKKYIRKSMNAPMLEKEHELDLARRWQEDGDEDALHELIRSYARLVISRASKFRHYGLPYGDLIQEGNIGLMEAAKRFDPERGVRFSTYAGWWIRSSMQDYVLRNWSIVRTGTTSAQKSLFFNFRRLRAKIEGEQESEGLTPEGRQQIADELGVRLKDVKDMEQRLTSPDYSLNNYIGEEEDTEWQNMLEDERLTPEEVVSGMKDSETRSAWLNDALRDLSDRERMIVKNRDLAEDENIITLERLGNRLGISKERVRQLEARALDKLKNNLTKRVQDHRDLLIEKEQA